MAGKKEPKRDNISDLDVINFVHNSRTPKAKAVDNGTKARITKNVGLWIAQPNRYDIEGVDTPKGAKKNPVIKKGAAKILSSKYGVKVN